MATPSERPALSLSQAAKATGKHRNTIRNALVGDRFPNAYRDGAGSWRIPAGDLLAAGFTLYAPSAPDAVGAEPATSTSSTASTGSTDELERLREEVRELRRRMELAEAIAAERERIVERLLAVLPALPAEGRTSWRWPWSRRADR